MRISSNFSTLGTNINQCNSNQKKSALPKNPSFGADPFLVGGMLAVSPFVAMGLDYVMTKVFKCKSLAEIRQADMEAEKIKEAAKKAKQAGNAKIETVLKADFKNVKAEIDPAKLAKSATKATKVALKSTKFCRMA